MKKSFILYQDQQEVFNALTNVQAGKLIKGIFDYCSGADPLLDKITSLAFISIKQTLLRDDEKWKKIKNARKEAGRLGGLKKAENERLLPSKPSKIKQSLANQAVSVSVSVSDSVINKTNSSNTEYLLNLPNTDLEEFTQVYECTRQEAIGKAEEMYHYLISKGITKEDYRAYFINILNKNFGKKGGLNGKTFHYPRKDQG